MTIGLIGGHINVSWKHRVCVFFTSTGFRFVWNFATMYELKYRRVGSLEKITKWASQGYFIDPSIEGCSMYNLFTCVCTLVNFCWIPMYKYKVVDHVFFLISFCFVTVCWENSGGRHKKSPHNSSCCITLNGPLSIIS